MQMQQEDGVVEGRALQGKETAQRELQRRDPSFPQRKSNAIHFAVPCLSTSPERTTQKQASKSATGEIEHKSELPPKHE
jgi:hypothetical protein